SDQYLYNGGVKGKRAVVEVKMRPARRKRQREVARRHHGERHAAPQLLERPAVMAEHRQPAQRNDGYGGFLRKQRAQVAGKKPCQRGRGRRIEATPPNTGSSL